MKNKVFLSILILLLLTFNVQAATQLKKTVKPSGGDYTSLEACMNDNEQDLVANDKYFDVEIDGTWSSADTSAVTIHNYTTDATRYINIYTTATAFHGGTLPNGSTNTGYLNSPGASSNITLSNNFVTINGIAFQKGSSDWSSIISATNYVGYETIKRCLAKGSSAAGNSFIGTSQPRNTWYIYNNIVYGFIGVYAGGVLSVGSGEGDSNTHLYIYNNTVYGCLNSTSGQEAKGISIDSGANDYIINNLFLNCTICISLARGTHSGSNNATSDGTGDDSPLTDGIVDKTDYASYFVDTTIDGGEDFHLLDTATDFIGGGADLSGTFTDDIDGDTRSAWDIGADEYVGGAPPVTAQQHIPSYGQGFNTGFGQGFN
jgi:hypothetical protein